MHDKTVGTSLNAYISKLQDMGASQEQIAICCASHVFLYAHDEGGGIVVGRDVLIKAYDQQIQKLIEIRDDIRRGALRPRLPNGETIHSIIAEQIALDAGTPPDDPQ